MCVYFHYSSQQWWWWWYVWWNKRKKKQNMTNHRSIDWIETRKCKRDADRRQLTYVKNIYTAERFWDDLIENIHLQMVIIFLLKWTKQASINRISYHHDRRMGQKQSFRYLLIRWWWWWPWWNPFEMYANIQFNTTFNHSALGLVWTNIYL